MPVAKKKTTKRAVKNVYNESQKKADKAIQAYWDKKWDELEVPTKRAVRKPFIDVFKADREAYLKDRIKDLTYESKEYKDYDEIGADNDPGIDVPLHTRGLTSKWNFQKTKKRMPWYDKVTWVLTAVNVAILISLVIKNL